MEKVSLAALAALVLSACADNAPSPGANAAVAVTAPFYAVGKITACVVTVAVAGPLGGLAALAPGDDARYFQGEIAHGLTANCGTSDGITH